MASGNSQPGKPRHGASAVELACILPVVIVLALGTVDLGRIAHYENVLSNAARVGADYGATHRLYSSSRPQWESRIVAHVREEAAHLPHFDESLLEVVVETVVQPDGTRRVEVQATYPFQMIVDWPGLPRDVELVHRTSQQEYR